MATEAQRQAKRNWYLKNKDKNREYQRKWYREHKEEVKQKRQNNPEYREKDSKRQKVYYQNHKEKILAYNREYAKANRKKRTAWQMTYRKSNAEKLKEQGQIYVYLSRTARESKMTMALAKKLDISQDAAKYLLESNDWNYKKIVEAMGNEQK